jgi:hypothetical protein
VRAHGQARERRGRLQPDDALTSPHGFDIRNSAGAELRPNRCPVDGERQRAHHQVRISPRLVRRQRPVAVAIDVRDDRVSQRDPRRQVQFELHTTRVDGQAAAWRYSSRRCADTPATPTIAIVRARTPAVRVLPREPRTVIVGWIAVDGMDVVDAAVRRVEDSPQ